MVALKRYRDTLVPRSPDEFELERLKQMHTNELELAAIERMAHMSSETYRTPYLDKESLLGLERMKFLNRAIHRLQTTDEKVREHAKTVFPIFMEIWLYHQIL